MMMMMTMMMMMMMMIMCYMVNQNLDNKVLAYLRTCLEIPTLRTHDIITLAMESKDWGSH